MRTALPVIDVQEALAHNDANGAERYCPEAADNISSLLSAFRERGDTIIHVHHHGTDPEDPFYSEASGKRLSKWFTFRVSGPNVIMSPPLIISENEISHVVEALNVGFSTL